MMKKNKLTELRRAGAILAPAMTYLTLVGLVFIGIGVAAVGAVAFLLTGDDFFGFPMLAGSLLGAMGALGFTLRMESSFKAKEPVAE